MPTPQEDYESGDPVRVARVEAFAASICAQMDEGDAAADRTAKLVALLLVAMLGDGAEAYAQGTPVLAAGAR